MSSSVVSNRKLRRRVGFGERWGVSIEAHKFQVEYTSVGPTKFITTSRGQRQCLESRQSMRVLDH
jgi:hypothetical protein